MSGFDKKAIPPLRPSNPGIGVEGEVAFTAENRNWTEEVNTVRLAASVLKRRGYSVKSETTWLEHPDSGYALLPRLVGVQPLDDGSVQTVTTIRIYHAKLAPKGVFEYQHAAGNNATDSISKGFEQWVELGFVPLLDALRPEPESCMAMEISFPARDGEPARVRRAVLGPVLHFMERPPANAEETVWGSDRYELEDAREEHPFCPCCLLTRSYEAFRELARGNGFCGLHLYAARDAEGIPQAECRVNGDDWEKGAQALREYARTWPEAGYEIRQQYVVLHNVEQDR